MRIIIIGSGPAGVSAALGALEQGEHVTMIDPGKKLDKQTIELKNELSRLPVHQWPEDKRKQLLYGHTLTPPSLHKKRLFGSEFATVNSSPHILTQHCCLTSSHAVGGLSNLWGRGIEPPYKGEYEHWLYANELDECFSEILKHIPLASGKGNLDEIFSLHTECIHQNEITTLSNELLDRWIKKKKSLHNDGVHFGVTRLALEGCQYCGLCFYGCVYNAMYDSTQLLHKLKEFDTFDYTNGFTAQSYRSTESYIRINTLDEAGKTTTFDCDKLILAAGSIETTHIIMKSEHYTKSILKQSDLIKMPFLSFRSHRYDD
ncbi:MAG: hypothetical protein MK137_06245, partial [Rickettsiales bacterium]|nr:hypothetical protein [Rickettsiales bacterium]